MHPMMFNRARLLYGMQNQPSLQQGMTPVGAMPSNPGRPTYQGQNPGLRQGIQSFQPYTPFKHPMGLPYLGYYKPGNMQGGGQGNTEANFQPWNPAQFQQPQQQNISEYARIQAFRKA